MDTSFLQQRYAAQTAKEGRVIDTPIPVSSIRTVIDPRFDALLNRAATSIRSNQVTPNFSTEASSPNAKSTEQLDSISPSENKRQLLSPACKQRLQGLLIGLLITVVSVAVILAVLLTRSSSSTTTSTSTVSSCNTLQWNPIGVTIIGNGSSGNSLSQLNAPSGVYLDVNDVIYVADTGNHRILRISLETNGTINTTVAAGTTDVSTFSSSKLNEPRAVYVDSQENLYIVDSGNFRVLFWPYGASNGSTVAGSLTGASGAGLAYLSTSYALYVDSASNVYVSDFGNARIVKWSPGASTGILIAGNGTSGYSSSQLRIPVGITANSQGDTLYIADFGAYTIVSWPLNAITGTIVAGLNATYGNIPSLLNSPWGILRDIYGNLYVGDCGNHRIQMFCAVGSSFSSGKTIAGIGASQLSARGLSEPTAIAFDSQMNLYVADYNNHRVQKFLRTN